ncbi:membrane protein insertase YidC [Thermodesulfobacteriota bacterium]
MDKRTLLAFVLSFLILFIWLHFFGGEKKEVPTKEQTVPLESSERIKETSKVNDASTPVKQKTSDLTSMPTNIESGVEEKKIVVDTPLYRAVFSNAGPTIKSIRLKKYMQAKDPDSPPIELVTLEKGMGDFINVKFESASLGKGVGKLLYEVKKDFIQLNPDSSPESLTFTAHTSEGLEIIQVYRFSPDQYGIRLEVQVNNLAGQRIEGVLSVGLRALPPEGESKYYSYVGLAALIGNNVEEIELEEESDEEILSGQIGWIGYEDDYFISAIIPEEPSKATFRGTLNSLGVLEGTYRPNPVTIAPSGNVSGRYLLYLGPRDIDIIKKHNSKLAKAVSFGWTDIIAKPLLYVLKLFNKYINNYGVSIILLTILIKILFWPLTHKSYKSMKEMRKLQPMMTKIREKHKGDKQKLNQEMMALYKTYKVNPMSGCFPMLIQIPVFFALFRILGSAIELRHAPFMLWIDDLSAPDRLFNFPFDIPLMDSPDGIPVLTLLMGASMFIQQKMTPTPGDPTQAKIMMFLPIIFTVMFINFPSGLVLYWFVNNVISIGQQYRIHRGSA